MPYAAMQSSPTAPRSTNANHHVCETATKPRVPYVQFALEASELHFLEGCFESQGKQRTGAKRDPVPIKPIFK